jgi:hypothetical protein
MKKNGGLSNPGLLEVLFCSPEHEFGDIEFQELIGFVE